MPFYHGQDKFIEGTELDPKFDYANSLVIYTLTPGATSYFKDIKICPDKCLGGEKLEFVLSGAKKLLISVSISLAALVAII